MINFKKPKIRLDKRRDELEKDKATTKYRSPWIHYERSAAHNELLRLTPLILELGNDANSRLSDHEVKSIIATIEQLDRHAEIYLFGSRVDPNLKGGDIDLLLVSSRLSFNDKITILTLLEEKSANKSLIF